MKLWSYFFCERERMIPKIICWLKSTYGDICAYFMMSVNPLLTKMKGWAVCRLSRLVCGFSISWQCNNVIGCEPNGRISQTDRKPTTHFTSSLATVTQSVELLPHKLEDVGSTPNCDRIFSHSCAHFVMCSRRVITQSWFRLRGPVQYRTALVKCAYCKNLLSLVWQWVHTFTQQNKTCGPFIK